MSIEEGTFRITFQLDISDLLECVSVDTQDYKSLLMRIQAGMSEGGLP